MKAPTENRILPDGSEFIAIVGGKPTGLAGCTQTAACPKASECLRADSRLGYRTAMGPNLDNKCYAFIHSSEPVQ